MTLICHYGEADTDHYPVLQGSAYRIDILLSVCHIATMKVRKVVSRGTPSYQLGHYEMQGEKGKRRSVFKVDVHLGEHPTVEDALVSWSDEIEHLRSIGRENQADKLGAKLKKIQRLIS